MITESRQHAALPSYMRRIVEDLYKAHHIPRDERQKIECAMSLLMEEGKRFCIDFGVLNARALAHADDEETL